MLGGSEQRPRHYGKTISTANSSLIKRCSSSGDNPSPVTDSKPNLTITSLVIENNGRSYDYFKGQNPIIIKDKSTKFKITFANNGGSTAPSCDYRMYISPYSDLFPNVNLRLYNLFRSGGAGSISKNSKKFSGPSHTFRSREGPLVMQNYGTYFIYIDIDPKNRVKESNESIRDNVWRFSVQFQNKASKGGDAFAKAIVDSEPYNLDIFDFMGQKILSRKVDNLEEENRIIGNLPKDLYIVKSKNGDRKVYN